jgi:hypothetical protein
VAAVGEHNRPIDCPWCRTTHGRRFLCDPAAAILTTYVERGESGTMPTVELDAPVDLAPDPNADTLVSQLVVKGALIPAPGGVTHPALVFSGQDAERRRLPQWVYVGTDGQLRAASQLVHDMTEMAIRRADAQNGGR